MVKEREPRAQCKHCGPGSKFSNVDDMIWVPGERIWDKFSGLWVDSGYFLCEEHFKELNYKEETH
jgi:hypothetical protein